MWKSKNTSQIKTNWCFIMFKIHLKLKALSFCANIRNGEKLIFQVTIRNFNRIKLLVFSKEFGSIRNYICLESLLFSGKHEGDFLF